MLWASETSRSNPSDIPPNLLQTVTLTGNQMFKHRRLWGPHIQITTTVLQDTIFQRKFYGMPKRICAKQLLKYCEYVILIFYLPSIWNNIAHHIIPLCTFLHQQNVFLVNSHQLDDISSHIHACYLLSDGLIQFIFKITI